MPPPQQLRERDPHVQPGEPGANADVAPEAGAETRILRSIGIDDVRLFEVTPSMFIDSVVVRWNGG
ncbi:hypothetical protein [Streptomyces sp. NPDC091217]|uniref:hypothetical protein n=1 Tax=Streptomyces sp. NPDC091217 TaxID=3365975 RepID=UPI0037F8FFD7